MKGSGLEHALPYGLMGKLRKMVKEEANAFLAYAPGDTQTWPSRHVVDEIQWVCWKKYFDLNSFCYDHGNLWFRYHDNSSATEGIFVIDEWLPHRVLFHEDPSAFSGPTWFPLQKLSVSNDYFKVKVPSKSLTPAPFVAASYVFAPYTPLVVSADVKWKNVLLNDPPPPPPPSPVSGPWKDLYKPFLNVHDAIITPLFSVPSPSSNPKKPWYVRWSRQHDDGHLSRHEAGPYTNEEAMTTVRIRTAWPRVYQVFKVHEDLRTPDWEDWEGS